MASQLAIVSASPLIGSPIIYQVKAATLSNAVAFHRVNLTVTAYQQGKADESRQLTLSSPAESGEVLTFDISSAIRAVADSYQYEPEPPSYYPYFIYSLRASDEYMQNGDLIENVGVVSLQGGKVIMGAYSDLERILAGGNKLAQHFSRKPSSSPEIVAVGERIVYAMSYSTPLSEASIINGPHSQTYVVGSEGSKTVNGRPVYALPANQPDRYEFRFVNGLGVIESCSMKALKSVEMNVSKEEYIRAITEQFSTFSRGLITKSNDYETWKMTTGPIDEEWQSWYLHEFLMAKFVWIKISSHWLPCHIVPDETVKGIDRSNGSICEVVFNVRLDLNGSPLAALAI